MEQREPSDHYVVLANPSPRSFCHAIAHTYAAEVQRQRQRQTVTVTDLCGIAFDPVLKNVERADRDDRHHPWIAAEFDRVSASGALVLVYPIWFGGPPAILKGYVDESSAPTAASAPSARAAPSAR